MLTNTTKAKLAAGEPVFGCFFRYAEPSLAEYVAMQGWDFLVFDGEHGTLQPARRRGPLPRARAARRDAPRPGHDEPAAHHPALPRQRHPRRPRPVGQHAGRASSRPSAPSSTRRAASAGWPARAPPSGASDEPLDAFVERANRETMVVVHIETQEAVDAIEAYVAIDGVDVLFLGPTDLSQSLGHPGQPGHPDVAGGDGAGRRGRRAIRQGARHLRRDRRRRPRPGWTAGPATSRPGSRCSCGTA